jgi:HSP20 family molecular chaperone IbpA
MANQQERRQEQEERRQGQGETTMVRSDQGETGLASRQYQDSFSLLDAMFERMQRDFFGTSLFNTLLPTRSGNGNGGGGAPRLPRTQVRDTGDAVEVTAELPGIETEDVQIELQDDMLTIRGETTVEEERDGVKVERSVSFLRQLELPDGVDAEQARASYRNGVLSIRFPKRSQRENVRQIPISNEASEQRQKTEQRQKSEQQRRGAA